MSYLFPINIHWYAAQYKWPANASDFYNSLFADDTIFCLSTLNLELLLSDANKKLDKASILFKANKFVSKTKIYDKFRNKKKIPFDENISIL